MLSPRPPIVVILGHVDHGKTTLLDYLRHSHIAAREAGGITQSIRSFQLLDPTLPAARQVITFIDTPGHAAFAAMRSRGSRLADIAILVVAANDGVMPQTKESIEFINQAHIPFIVALNKSDLPTADPDRVKTQLTQIGVIVEDFGGDIPSVSISAKTGSGIPDLLELIDLLSQLHPPVADPAGQLEVVVLESRLDPQRGPLAVCVVKNGTLTVGQNLYQQAGIGKARALTGSDSNNLKTALPSTPVEIIGLTSVPEVGSILFNQPQTSVLSGLSKSLAATPQDNMFNFILKADVAGSLEAITQSLPSQANILSGGTGDVTENDVVLAKASSAPIFVFNARVPNSVAKLAEIEKVTINKYQIIYELLEEIKKLLTPPPQPIILGRATIAADFKIDSDRIAGCRCLEGQIAKTDQLRVMRQDKEIGLVHAKSLQLGKVSAEKVKTGQEFGILFSPYLDFKLGDIIMAIKSSP